MSQRFPARGQAWEQVRTAMEDARKDDLPWRGACIFKPAYFAGEDIVEVANAAYLMYITDNALYGHSSYPSIGRYEREVVGMLLELLDKVAGHSTRPD